MKINASNIMAEFKARQTLISKDEPVFNNKQRFAKSVNTGSSNNKYSMYKAKLEAENFDKFNNQDILYFFLDVAKENGSPYIVANAQKEMRQFKICKERGIPTEELLAIIEFVYTSGQTYLDVKQFHPGILASKWINTLRRDTQLWLDDKFDPNARQTSKQTKKFNKVREWSGETTTEEKAVIGEWDL